MTSSRASQRALWALILTVAVLGLVSLWRTMPVAAQTEPTPTPEPELTIYIVQPGDTLYAIATRFGISAELLAVANNIEDPNRLSIGQRLLVPPPADSVIEAPSSGITYTVQPGDTLHSLALSAQLPERELALANYLLRPDHLLIGQSLLLPGRAQAPVTLAGSRATVRPGDTLVGAAMQQGLAPWALVQANMLRSPLGAPPATRLWIPGDQADGSYLDWPEPFAAIDLYPIPMVQGETFSIQISVTLPASLTGTLFESPLTFFAEQGEQIALTGVNALAEDMAPTLTITVTTQDGEFARYAQAVPVAAGDFGTETVTVAAEVAAQMTADVVEEENQLLAELFAARTPVRQWEGLFALPTAGDITSSFGTRRTYNIPNGSAYHTGTDFGRMVGTPVYAPASGTVVFTGTLTVRGNVIVIDHGWGVMTGYWHLSAIHVAPGDPVAQGQHIGDIGNTGLSTGPHLHWEMRVNGAPIGGLQWVREEFP